jgi:sodium-dependent dicarboxylate transporter 2/3/5
MANNPPMDTIRSKIGFPLGILLAAAMWLAGAPDGMPPMAWTVAIIAVWMAVWWITEAIPIAATALIPILVLPLAGVSPIREAAAPYANPTIYLFLGGFIIAFAMEKSRLHRRIALNVLKRVGVKPSSIVWGFMLASAFLSMWVSNTATTLMMLPIGLSVLRLQGDATGPDADAFRLALVLAIAYGCNIGGVGTLIGTPPNAIMAGYLIENYQINVGFAQWMLIGLPVVAVCLPLTHFILTRWAFRLSAEPLPGGESAIHDEVSGLGRMSVAERLVTVIFLLTATLWVTQPLLVKHIPAISDTGIAIFGALLCFILPTDLRTGERVLVWEDTRGLPWDVLLIFGGGLSLAGAIEKSGLAAWLGQLFTGLQGVPVLLVILVAVLTIIFFTEVTSNTATAAAFIPVLATVALALGLSPMMLVVPATIAASYAFMMPVGTPPNAIVYASGYVTLPQMAKAGLWLNVVLGVAITLLTTALIGLVFGV